MVSPSEEVNLPVPQPLRDAVRAAQQNHAASLDRLRVAVCAHVDELRERDVPHELIVSTIRRAVLEMDGHDAAGGARTAETLDRMIEWCDERREKTL